jgi:hypothetical protein
MDIEEGQEKQTKGTDNLFNGIIAEDFPNLEKESVTKCRKLIEHQTIRTKRERPLDTHRIKKRILKASKEKKTSHI